MKKIFFLAVILMAIMPFAFAEGTDSLRFCRVMTSNKACVLPVDCEFTDWLELINTGSETVSLSGCKIGKGYDVREAQTLPDVLLAPGESVILYCSKSEIAEPQQSYNIGFSLSADGMTLVLYDTYEREIQSLEVPKMAANSVYALRTDLSGYQIQSVYDESLGQDLMELMTSEFDADGVYISEVVASNKTVWMNENGEYTDYIELYNGGSSDVDLTGWALTDDPLERLKWRFPSGTVISAGKTLMISADGGGQGLHTNFHLTSSGEHIFLLDDRYEVVSEIEYDGLGEDCSYERGKDGFCSVSYEPSPNGLPDTDDSAIKLPETATPTENVYAPGLYLNEVMVIPDGGENDWVELVNESDTEIDLSGYGLSDNVKHPRKWCFPDGTKIGAGMYLVVHLIGGDGTAEEGTLCADFALSTENDTYLMLSAPDGTVLERMTLSVQRKGVSYGRLPGGDTYRYFVTPTPGGVNEGENYGYLAPDVIFSEEGGFKTDSVTLTLKTIKGMTIYYTTNGKKPTTDSKVYSKPIEISDTTVVKAIATRDDCLTSYVQGNTYLYDEGHTVKYVVCVRQSLCDQKDPGQRRCA